MYRRRRRRVYGQFHDQFCTRYHVFMVNSIHIKCVISDRGCSRVHRFKIGVYPPAILPMLAVYGSFYRPLPSLDPKLNRTQVSLAMEAIGDITASAEVSRLSVVGLEFDSRIQGGILVRPFIGL